MQSALQVFGKQVQNTMHTFGASEMVLNNIISFCPKSRFEAPRRTLLKPQQVVFLPCEICDGVNFELKKSSFHRSGMIRRRSQVQSFVSLTQIMRLLAILLSPRGNIEQSYKSLPTHLSTEFNSFLSNKKLDQFELYLGSYQFSDGRSS